MGQEGARKGWLLGTCRSTLMDGWKEVMWGEEGVLTSGGSGISALSPRLDLVEKLRAELAQEAVWQMSFFHTDWS